LGEFKLVLLLKQLSRFFVLYTEIRNCTLKLTLLMILCSLSIIEQIDLIYQISNYTEVQIEGILQTRTNN